MLEKNFEIDMLEVNLYVDHDAEKLSNGTYIYSKNYLKNLNELKNISDNDVVLKNKPKWLSSEDGKNIKITSLSSSCINVSGNIYKWLKNENILGETDLIKLVYEFVQVLQTMNLVHPTSAQIQRIIEGDYRVYKADVKRDLIFENKDRSLRYLDHIQRIGYFPNKAKEKYPNGVYFGKKSKTRWSICYYHKSTELKAKLQRFNTEPKLFELAERMIRAEASVYNDQLKEWKLSYGYQWGNKSYVNNLFKEKFSRLRLPDQDKRDKVLDIIDKNDRKFYTLLKEGCIEDYYSRSTIHNKRMKFYTEYGVDIDLIKKYKNV
ncbi:phage/plasmid replication protein, II/X family [Acinetobacter junii]|uniref:phage/plasmid replication protein, II/X family n=2 Tax=Acinetobacter junii TaxID=40215 RepID=UPI001BAB762D|nr:phage/plasmid replication protein, II/X family [Acinetobacter junii]QUS48996.1 phage replication protein [Acinetobacter junii]